MSIFDAVIENTENTITTNNDNPMPFAYGNIEKSVDEKFRRFYSFGLNLAAPKKGVSNVTIEEWEKAANWDFSINNVAALYQHNGQMHESKKRIFVRSDTSEELGDGTTRYKITQPKKVLEFVDQLSNHYGFNIEKLGYADNGTKLFAFLKNGEDFDVTGNGDMTASHMLFYTSCDGSTTNVIQPFFESFFCMNQLPIMKSMFAPIKIRHTREFDPSECLIEMGLLQDAIGNTREIIKTMSQKKVNNREALAAIYSLMKTEKASNITEESTRNLNRVMGVYDKYMGKGMGATNEGRNGTLWGVLNAITEYTDHEQGNNPNNRFKSSMTGNGLTLKERAFETIQGYALEEAGINLEYVPAELEYA